MNQSTSFQFCFCVVDMICDLACLRRYEMLSPTHVKLAVFDERLCNSLLLVTQKRTGIPRVRPLQLSVDSRASEVRVDFLFEM